ncbi:MAG: LutC/YkgG family protein [Solirubrobacteraceae bacterium]
MSAAREEILGRIRGALADVPESERPADVAVAADYRRRGTRDGDELVSVLVQRLEDYHAVVRQVGPGQLPRALTEACSELGLRRIVVPAALPAQWRPDGVELIEDERLSAAQLDRIDGAITGCAGAIAETGTLILDGQGVSGRRVITLVPDHHICVVQLDQIVESVPEGVAAVRAAVVEEGAPITLVSGPSASSDIELSRVEGVHGPRHLRVLIVTEAECAAAGRSGAGA